MKHGYFITGTDTGVGKTLVAAALVYAFARRGFATAGMKPVATGCVAGDGWPQSDDAAQLRAAGNVPLAPQIANPCAYPLPLAPQLAAARAGTEIALPSLMAAFTTAAAQVEVLIVEGVGGFRVPLNDMEDTADLAALMGLPVILVVGMRLGCINHALLTAQAVAASGLMLAGWVGNSTGTPMEALEDNLQTLRLRLPAPCLGVIPPLAVADFCVAATCLDSHALVRAGAD